MAVCTLARKKPSRRAVRAWVLTFPFPLRFLLAAQPEALTAVLAVVQRAISTFVIRHADTLSHRIVRVLERRGLLIADPQHPSLDRVPDSSLQHLQAA